MISRARIAIRFFFVGLAVGVLLAPRSGVETRRRLRQRADRFLNDLLDATTLGVYQSSSSADGGRTAAPADKPARRTAAKTTAQDAVVGGD
ncbi:MAG TPA: hypothetical protein VKU35_03550 [Candidatus Limnocylindria bacterium]|nr:hypothetical protein [Candidatus Limnocylindria bacterium]